MYIGSKYRLLVSLITNSCTGPDETHISLSLLYLFNAVRLL